MNVKLTSVVISVIIITWEQKWICLHIYSSIYCIWSDGNRSWCIYRWQFSLTTEGKVIHHVLQLPWRQSRPWGEEKGTLQRQMRCWGRPPCSWKHKNISKCYFMLKTNKIWEKETATNTSARDPSQTDKKTWCCVCLQAELKLLLLYIKEELVDIDKIKDTVTTTPKYLQSEDGFAPDCSASYNI